MSLHRIGMAVAFDGCELLGVNARSTDQGIETMLKRILAGICDPKYTATLARYTLELAREFDAAVTAIAVTDIVRLANTGRVPLGAGSYVKEYLSERTADNEAAISQSMDILVRQLNSADIACTVMQSQREPIETLAKAARFQDLMIFGLKGLMEHGVTSEPPDELPRLISAGVRPILATAAEYREIRRVLIAYSGSVESARAMREYANLNLWPKAETKVVHFGKPEAGPELLRPAQSYLSDRGISSEVELLAGSARDQLLKHADDWKADLIVLGNSAKSLLRKSVFGETAIETIRNADLPLFLH